MPSPFPGMDPYLDAHWGDVHTRLITYASDQLQTVLPRDLRARVERRVVAVEPEMPVFPEPRSYKRQSRAGASAVVEPLVIDLRKQPPPRVVVEGDAGQMETQRFLEIRETGPASKLITVLEILSPSNRAPGKSQSQYLQKQWELIKGGVSLVEIDLLREGDWIVAVPEYLIDPRRQTHYRVVVRRGWRRSSTEYYPISLREKLPAIRVPLRESDADVPLDLQALVNRAYDNGAYDEVDYRRQPGPPLTAEDARWADRLLREAGLRRHRGTRRH